MSEPTTCAATVHRPMPGLLHWTIHDERIDFRSEAYAVESDSGVTVIDPLPLSPTALAELGPVERIVLTGGFHQRAAWSLRELTGARVLVPRGARGLQDRPDGEYADREEPAPGLVALDRPGPTNPHHVLLWSAPDHRRVLFSADLLVRDGSGPFRLAAAEHHEDLERTRDSVRRLLGLPVDVLCPAHGEPLLQGAPEAMRSALD